ncbi:Acyl-CoA N-acyltransferase [Moelleriella libera RCEF 2490]|uniref:Acyl-CoA N-acyltransferase n=1 Tax=Moelleriella libera RCEF 2490 TaxID=1081109 RepID=A0A166U8K6_9HYPO|nr:Acyl-CoA N-acyltransferase [Moelleriella libera RCEF 2490]
MSSSTSAVPLILAKATPDERVKIWTEQQPCWGAQYTVETFIQREVQLLQCLLAKDDGVTAWILTDPSAPPDHRPILSSLEIFRKRALVRDDKHGTLRDATAYGVASVFTFEQHRRKNYASKMLSLVGEKLTEEGADFSILYSDIGKTFYARHHWVPFPSFHLAFPSADNFVNDAPCHHSPGLVKMADLVDIADSCESILRDKMGASRCKDETQDAVQVALLPDLATFVWHLVRQTFLCEQVLGEAPDVHGAWYEPPRSDQQNLQQQSHQRVLMLWSCTLSGGRTKPENNVMTVLHLAIEDDAISDQELSKALEFILGIMHTEARKWLCNRIEIWSPSERIQRLVSNMADIKASLVVREESNVASLRWFGDGPVSRVQWVNNEKFAWC